MLNWTSRPSKTPLRGRFHSLSQFFSLAGLACLALAWLAPNHYPPWTSFHGEAAAFAALLLICVGHLFGEHERTARAALFAGGASVTVVTVQCVVGQIAYAGDALLSAVYLVGACWSWWLGRTTVFRNQVRAGPTDPFSWLAGAFILGASTSVLVGVLQWLRMEPRLGIFAVDRGPDMRVFANLAQPNHLATLCSMAAVLAIWKFRSGRLKPWHLGSLLSWTALGVTMTESRSGLLGAMLAGLVLIAAAPDMTMRKVLLRPVTGWWTMLAAGALAWPRLNDALFLSAARTAHLTSDNARVVMWKQVWAAIQDSPWWGYGWRQTMFAQKMAAKHVSGWLATDYAHNLVLDLAIWIGLPAALLLTGFGVIWIIRSLWRVTSERQLFLMAATVPFLFHCMFEFPFAYAYFLFPVAWMWGQLSAEQRDEGFRLPATAMHRAAGIALLVAYGTVVTAIAVEYLDVEEDYRVMRFELRHVGRVPAGYEVPRLHLLTQLDALLKMGRMVPARHMSADQLDALRVASERNGWATLDMTYAAALGLNGQPEEAARRLAQITSVYGAETGQQAKELFHGFSIKYPELEQIAVR